MAFTTRSLLLPPHVQTPFTQSPRTPHKRSQSAAEEQLSCARASVICTFDVSQTTKKNYKVNFLFSDSIVVFISFYLFFPTSVVNKIENPYRTKNRMMMLQIKNKITTFPLLFSLSYVRNRHRKDSFQCFFQMYHVSLAIWISHASCSPTFIK